VRVLGRRWAVGAVVVAQLFFVVRGYHSAHKEFAYQMFAEATDWRADVYRVTRDGERVPVDQSWSGYTWAGLVRARGLAYPQARHHADASLDNQLAFLDASLDYVADHTPRDTETAYLEADVTYWKNQRAPQHTVLRSHERSDTP